jgi:hypothetical protein
MKIGDLAVWSKEAAQWTSESSPNVGDVAGIVIAVVPMRRANCRTRPARVRIHNGEEAFYITPDFVEAANENR